MARKLNKKFIVILLSVFVFLTVAIVCAWVFRDVFRTSVPKLVARGDEAWKNGDFETASSYYGRAASRDKNDIPMQIKAVDAFEYTVGGDWEKFGKLRQLYSSIVQNSPRSVPALLRILRVQQMFVSSDPGDRAGVRSLQDTAEKILANEPDNREAAKAAIVAVLEPYDAGLPVEPETVTAAVASAVELWEKDPTDGEVVLMLGRFGQQRAEEAFRRGSTTGTKEALDALKKQIDSAVAKAPQVATVLFAKFDAYRQIAVRMPDMANADREKMLQEAAAALTAADANARPSDDRSFLRIRLAAISMLEAADPKKADERYKQLLEELPSNRIPRLAYAQFLGRQPGRIDDAVAILSAKWSPASPLKAMDSLEQARLATVEQTRLAVLKLKSLENVKDDNVRQQRIKEVETIYADLKSARNDSAIDQSWLLRIEGGLAIEKSQLADAINKYDSALKLLSPDSTNALERDLRNEVLQELATTHLLIGNLGRARPVLQELVSRDPNNAVARVNLTKILIAEQNYDGARQQVEFLATRYRESPLIQSLAIAVAAMRQDTLREKYKPMEETTDDQRRVKLQVAAALNDGPEVIRLSKQLVKNNPADITAVTNLSRVLYQQNRRDEAVAAVTAGLAANPGNEQLKALLDGMSAQTPIEQRELLESRVETISDPYQREIARSSVARRAGDIDKAVTALQKASEIDPKNPAALEQLFELRLAQQKFDDAQKVLDRLNDLQTDRVSGQLKAIMLLASRAEAEPSSAKSSAMMDDAKAQAAKVTTDNRQIAAASLLYARLLQRTGQLADAAEQYRQTIDKASTNVDAIRGAIECYLGLQQSTEARAFLDLGQRVAPNDPGIAELNLRYELVYGDPQKAIEVLKTRLEADKKNVSAWLALGQGYEQVIRLAEQRQDTATVAKYSQQTVDHWQAAVGAFPDDLRLTSVYADALRRAGRPTAAEKAVEALIARPGQADKPEAAQLLAEQYTRSDKAADAERVLREIINRVKPVPAGPVLQLANLYAVNGKYDEALAVLELKKDDPQTRQQRIQYLIDANRLSDAHNAAEEAISQSPSPAVYLLAGLIELRQNKLDQAEGFFNKVLGERPDDAAALYYRSQVKMNRRPADLPGAQADLTRVRDLAPNAVEVRITLANILAARGDTKQATEELETAWSMSQSKAALMPLVDLYGAATPPQWVAAAKVLEGAAKIEQLKNDADIMLTTANVMAARGDTEKAVQLAKSAIATKPDNVALQQSYLNTLLRAKAYRPLLADSEEYIKKDNTRGSVYVVRGQAYARLNQQKQATQEFAAALNLAKTAGQNGSYNESIALLVIRTLSTELGPKAAIEELKKLPETADSRLNLAALQQADGDAKGALATIDRVLTDESRLAPGSLAQARQMQGSLALSLTPPDAAKARTAFEELQKLSPDDPSNLNNLAYTLTLPGSGGTVADALKHSTRAYELTRNLPVSELVLYIWDTHGWILTLNGRMLEGLDLLRQASEQAEFPEVYVHMAAAYVKTGDLAAADRALDSAKNVVASWERNRKRVDPALKNQIEDLSKAVKAKPTDG